MSVSRQSDEVGVDVSSIVVPGVEPVAEQAGLSVEVRNHSTATRTSAEVSDIVVPSKRPGHVDLTRAWLAYALLGLFALEVLIGLIIAAVAPENSEALLRVLDKVITPTVGLVGAVSAFYYARGRD